MLEESGQVPDATSAAAALSQHHIAGRGFLSRKFPHKITAWSPHRSSGNSVERRIVVGQNFFRST